MADFRFSMRSIWVLQLFFVEVEAILYNFLWTTETFIRICSEKYKIPTPDVPQSISPRVPKEAAASLLLVSVTQSQSQILLLQHFTRELTKLTTFKVVVIISRWGGVSGVSDLPECWI